MAKTKKIKSIPVREVKTRAKKVEVANEKDVFRVADRDMETYYADDDWGQIATIIVVGLVFLVAIIAIKVFLM